MDDSNSVFIGLGGGRPQRLILNRANRHGLIAGATGTGKTVTLQGMAESLSAAGVPVFVADVKGDLAGMAMAGSPTGPMHESSPSARPKSAFRFSYADNPVIFWDLFGEKGKIRTTVSEMGRCCSPADGPQRGAKGVLNIAFRLATSRGCSLNSRISSPCSLIARAGRGPQRRYGNVTRATVGTIQRQCSSGRAGRAPASSARPALDIADS